MELSLPMDRLEQAKHTQWLVTLGMNNQKVSFHVLLSKSLRRKWRNRMNSLMTLKCHSSRFTLS